MARTPCGSKYAHSRKRSVVSGVTSECAPPITPATPMADSASAMTVIDPASGRSAPSSVVSRSPGRARRATTAGPLSRETS